MRLKVPRIKGTGFGVRLLAGTRKDIRTRYYGLGNNSKFVKAYTEDEDNPEYRDENYYYYVLKAPRFIFSLLREVEGPVSMLVGFGLENTSVNKRGKPGDPSILDDEGFGGNVVDGWTGFVSFTLQWDSRDDVVIARSGTFHEWSYETSRNSLLALHPRFEDIDFRRHTFTDARYRQLTSRVNLAHRTVFEVLEGSVPLYAYGEIGGSRRIKGLGGSDSLRGFDRQRFTDDVRFFTNSEFRYHISTYRLLKQYLEWHVASFFDTGRVWRDLGRFGLSGFHATAGAGMRLYWNSDFVVRVDFGRLQRAALLRVEVPQRLLIEKIRQVFFLERRLVTPPVPSRDPLRRAGLQPGQAWRSTASRWRPSRRATRCSRRNRAPTQFPPSGSRWAVRRWPGTV